jgi:hypothetical protein
VGKKALFDGERDWSLVESLDACLNGILKILQSYLGQHSRTDRQKAVLVKRKPFRQSMDSAKLLVAP